jgi:hypothetical protein
VVPHRGLIGRNQEDPAIDIIEGEIRAAQHDAFLEAERLIAKELRDRAERTIRPNGRPI